MRVLRAGVVSLAVVGMLSSAPSASGGEVDATVAAGAVQFEMTGGRYQLPTISYMRFTGSISSGTEVVIGQVTGSGAVLDTADLTYHPIELTRPDGRVAGTCSASETVGSGVGVDRSLTLACTVRIGDAPQVPVTLRVHGVARSVTGDGTTGTQRTTYEGAFASA